MCHLAWECLEIPQEELGSVAGERVVKNLLLSELPPRPQLGQAEENGWMDRKKLQ